MAGDPGAILIEDRGAFGHLIEPLRADGSMHLDARQPPAAMAAASWERTPFWRNAARSNLRRVERIVAAVLGEGDRAEDAGLATVRWHDQAGSITLTSSLARAGGPPDDRRAAEACRIAVIPGWRRPLSEGELASIADMSVIGRGSVRGMRMLTTSPPRDEDAAYVREPGPEPAVLDGIVAVDATRGMLIACPGRLLVVPVPSITHLRHETYSDGRTAGRSALYATIEGGRDLMIAEHDETHGLELVSRGLSRALELSMDRLEAEAS